jgi:hypothetical protein
MYMCISYLSIFYELAYCAFGRMSDGGLYFFHPYFIDCAVKHHVSIQITFIYILVHTRVSDFKELVLKVCG